MFFQNTFNQFKNVMRSFFFITIIYLYPRVVLGFGCSFFYYLLLLLNYNDDDVVRTPLFIMLVHHGSYNKHNKDSLKCNNKKYFTFITSLVRYYSNVNKTSPLALLTQPKMQTQEFIFTYYP